MTFVHGPEQATFQNEKPAKLRFFVGYVDEFAPGDGSDRVRWQLAVVTSNPATFLAHPTISLWLLTVTPFCAAGVPDFSLLAAMLQRHPPDELRDIPLNRKVAEYIALIIVCSLL